MADFRNLVPSNRPLAEFPKTEPPRVFAGRRRARAGAEVIRSVAWGFGCSMALGALVLLGSRNLAHFDAALVSYTFAISFASFGLAYRYAMWLSRPPTALLWRRGWQAFFRRGWRLRNARVWLSRIGWDVLLNRFIVRRDRLRGLSHLLIMWGCILAVAITFPLVFGWLHFRPVAGDLSLYEAMVFGFPAFRFRHDSMLGFLLFHGLVWASFLVIAGVMLALRRRMREESASAVQRFAEDFVPLILLFAVSVTGLMLTASYTWMKGYGFTFVSLLHAVTVIGTFIWLPFGKLFHVFQRPAQLGVGFYQDMASADEKAVCRRCGHAFSSHQHIVDLIEVERQLGYRYELAGNPAEHYQWICPPCRRVTFAVAHGLLWSGRRGGAPLPALEGPLPMPTHANRGLGEGPLGKEDAENFHP
jgi:hypothetical protein